MPAFHIPRLRCLATKAREKCGLALRYNSDIEQNRRSQRFQLIQPVASQFGATQVEIVDLSVDGVGIEHPKPFSIGLTMLLRIAATPGFELRAAVRHSAFRQLAQGGGVYHSGLHFAHISPEAAEVLVNLGLNQVDRTIREWEANAKGLSIVGDLAEFQRARKASGRRLKRKYLWFRYVNGLWVQSPSLDPNQPIDGFAVDDAEDPGQVALLCRIYEKADEKARYCLRLTAQQAIAGR